jgi:hypothetical protein
MPVPGNLRKQSKADARSEITERRWGSMLAADAFRFVAINREALNLGGLAHPFQRFTVSFDKIFTVRERGV